MRIIVYLAIGFAAACAVAAYLLSGVWLLLFVLFCLAFIVGAGFLLRERGKALRIVLAGMAVGFLWTYAFQSIYLRPLEEYHDQTIPVRVEITDYSTHNDHGSVTEGTVFLSGRPYRIRLYSYSSMAMQPGDQLDGPVHLRYTRTDTFSDYYSSSGIYLVGYAEDSCTLDIAETIPAKYFAARLRRSITELLNRSFPADTLGFARALLLGDDNLLSYETNTQLSISGIRHVIAVSGQHVAILFSVLYVLIGYRKLLTPLVGLPVLLLFAALTGFTPSVNRACIMQALMILAMAFDKEYDPPTALAFSALVMLLLNPMTIASVSFQLSAACVIGIQLFYQKIHDYLMDPKRLGPGKGRSLKARITRSFVSTVSMSVSTMVTTLPLCALYFETISLVSILTNLLTLWVIGFLFCGIMAVCVTAVIWLPLAQTIAWVLSWPIRYVLLVSRLLAAFPLAAVYTQSTYIVLWLIFAYSLLAVFLHSKQKQPAALAFCVLLGLCIAIGASWLEPRLENYRMTVLDAGQGQCILVQEGGKHYMIDCGGDYQEGIADLAAQTLLSQGVPRLDGLILTHYDDDHAGALEYFLTRIDVKNLYLPNIKDTGTIQSDLIRTYFGRTTWIHPNSSLVLEEGMLQLFVGDSQKSEAESGLCVLCRLDNCDILITGDRNLKGEDALLQQVALPDLEILVAGHHGSRYSTGRPLLKQTTPELILISAGAHNSYGHPSPFLLERVKLFGCQILCTADNGTITIRG